MHVPRWPSFEHMRRLAKHIAANMARILQISTRCRMSKQTQPQCPAYDPTPAAGSQNNDESVGESQTENEKEHSIGQAYHLASIANARLRKEAERHDHDLRLLVGHANLLDQLTEKIEQVEPDFTIESLDPVLVVLPIPGMTRSKPLRRTRIDEILRKIDLSDDDDDGDLDDEVYDESDDEDDDIQEPVTPPKESFAPTGSANMEWHEHEIASKVELSIQQDLSEKSGHSYWPDLSDQRRVTRKESMPIIAVTFLDNGV